MTASSFYNRVKYTADAGGTGSFVTGAAVTGFLTPATASIPNATLVSYVAFSSNNSEWETGQGTYTSATATLARTTVRESSNAGSKVNFSSAPTVALDFQAQDVPAATAPGGSSGQIQYNNSSAFDGTNLWVTDGNTLEKYSSTTAQTLNIYNTRTDASNYERFSIDWSALANTLTLALQAAGTGTLRKFRVMQGASQLMDYDISNAGKITIANLSVGGSLAVASNLTVTGSTIASAIFNTTPAALSLSNGLNSNIANGLHCYSRITGPSGAFSVGGLAANQAGMHVILYNSTAQQMTLVNEDASSTVGNRIKTLTGADVVLRAGTSAASFIYDGTDARWILLSTN